MQIVEDSKSGVHSRWLHMIMSIVQEYNWMREVLAVIAVLYSVVRHHTSVKLRAEILKWTDGV